MPDRPWKQRHFFGAPDDLYAAGAVIAAWNLCEQSLAQLLYRTLKLDWQTLERVFNLLGNQARIDLLLLEGERLLREDEIAHLKVYTRYFSICRENRNLVAHGAYNRNNLEGGVSLTKASSKDRLTRNSFNVSTDEMRDVADAIYDLSQFGFLTAHAIWAGPERTLYAGERALPAPLPDIFLPPRKLIPSLPRDPRDVPLPPKS